MDSLLVKVIQDAKDLLLIYRAYMLLFEYFFVEVCLSEFKLT